MDNAINKLLLLIEELKELINTLEKKVNDKKSNAIFGRSYSLVGSSDSDFLIKTRGLVKILWGNKFIDLIKDGKINVNSKVIFSVDSVNDIGNKNGIYITSTLDIYLKVNDTVINLSQNSNDSFVSFTLILETSSELKFTALKNIGFIYDDISQIDDSSIKNGIVYVSSELSLYVIKEGTASKFSVSFPNPFNLQFIILKLDETYGSLVIKGYGINNSLAFDSLYIYTDYDKSCILSDVPITFNINSNNILSINENKISSNVDIFTNSVLSLNASSYNGFRLYNTNGESVLEIDKIIARKSQEKISFIIYPTYWSLRNNIILNLQQVFDTSSILKYAITLKYENQYLINDKLYIYGNILVENETYKLIKIPVEIYNIDSENSNIIYVLVISGVDTEVDSLVELPILVGSATFLASTNEEISLIRYYNKGIDLLLYSSFEEESDTASVKTRIGDLKDLSLMVNIEDTEVPVDNNGIYSENIFFKSALYISSYNLLPEDCSNNIPSTSWVHKLLPRGTIIMFNGLKSDIPLGWSICDGSNGTPNLIGKFIKAGIESGLTGGSNEVLLSINNLPSHNHSLSGLYNTSYDGSHSHPYNLPILGTGSAGEVECLVSIETLDTEIAGNHSHTLDLSGVETTYTGENVPIKIEPQYYSLIYIMKVI